MNGLLQLPDAGNSKLAVSCAEVLSLAEQELKAFLAAVQESFGRDQAAIAAQEWLDELSSICSLNELDFRTLTIAASRRLADRLDVDIALPIARVA